MNTGSVLAQFTITLTHAVSEPVLVDWYTSDGTAKAGIDYAAGKGTATFTPGETSKTISILVYGRAVGSEDRSFFVEMLPPVNAILGASIGECIIHVDTTGSTPVTVIVVPTGPRGLEGKSAYQVWLDLGKTGTEQDFINSLSPPIDEIAAEVAPLIDVGNTTLTAQGTESLWRPDATNVKAVARRVAYVGAAKIATVTLADGENTLAVADLAGDTIDFNANGFVPRILRAGSMFEPSWYVNTAGKLVVKAAVAGDVLYATQYDVVSKSQPFAREGDVFEHYERSTYNKLRSFEKGTHRQVTSAADAVLWEGATDGQGPYFRWDGTYPKTVLAGSTPLTTGGIAAGAWVSVGDASTRSDLASSEAGKGVEMVYNAAKNTDLAMFRQDYDLQVKPGNATAAEFGKRITDGVPPKIGCFGDSTMWGATVGSLGTQNPNNPPAQLAIALNRLTGLTFNVTNKAVSGSSLYEMIRGLAPYYARTFVEELAGPSADRDIIYCNHCINDSQTDRDITTYKQDLVTFIMECRKVGKTPILVTPNPNPQLLIINEAKSKRLANYVRVMRDVANRTGCDLVDNYAMFMASTKDFRIDEIVPDGAHLSNDAYRQAGYNLAIPLISANTIAEVGDVSGLGNSMYFDNLTNTRQIQWHGNRAGGVLSATRTAVEQGVNYAFILGKSSRAISILGLHWSSGAKCIATLNGLLLGEYYPTQRHGVYTNLDWDSQRNYYGRVMAGLKVLGINFNMSDFGLGDSLSFSGVTIPQMSNTIVNNQSGNSSVPYRIDCGDSVLLKNHDFANPIYFKTLTGDNALSIELISGVITIKLYDVTGTIQTVTMGSSVIAGKYDVWVSQYGISITISVGILSTTFNAVAPLPNLKVPLGSAVVHVSPTRAF